MELTVLSESQISSLQVTEKERKSNEAFATLASIIKHYNEGWQPSKGDLGYFVYSKKLLILWGVLEDNGASCVLGSPASHYAFAASSSLIGVRLAIKDYDLSQFMIKNYEQLYKDLWMEE